MIIEPVRVQPPDPIDNLALTKEFLESGGVAHLSELDPLNTHFYFHVFEVKEGRSFEGTLLYFPSLEPHQLLTKRKV